MRTGFSSKLNVGLRSRQGITNIKRLHIAGGLLILVTVFGGYYLYQRLNASPTWIRFTYLRTWFDDPAKRPDWIVHAGERCGDAPFVLPTNGYIGFLWGDSFRLRHRHQGLDIFGGEEVNRTPVLAAHDGYLTRLPTWKSSLIIRIPDNPLQPGHQIWIYYTHMADRQGNSFIAMQFPPGTSEVFVKAGDLLGYQGDYSGDPNNPTGVHLHFSIVKDRNGNFLNELDIRNTLDPSPYLGLPLNAWQNPDQIPVCNNG